jgi:hypothetical protein
MKEQEKNIAIELRKKGWSMGEISRKINVSKGSVSLWVGKIQLTSKQKKALSLKGHTKEAIENRRGSRLKNEKAKREIVINEAKAQVENISERELWLLGIMLYWAEGRKTGRGMVQFSNSDPEMIKIMMVFFRKICKVPEDKFRGAIHIHPHLDYRKAEKYWSGTSGIPLSQFYKTYRKMNIASKHKRDNLPMGTFDIYICNTKLFLTIFGWVQGVFKSY